MPPAAGFSYTPPSYLIRASDSTNRPWNNNLSKENEQGFGEYDANGENEYDLPQEDRPQTRRESYVDAHFHQRVRTKQNRYRDILKGELEVQDDGQNGDLSSSFGTNSTRSTSCSSRSISNHSIVDLSMENNTGVVVEDVHVPHEQQEGPQQGTSGEGERQQQHQQGYTNLNGDNGIHQYDVEDEEEDDSVLLAAANVDSRRVQIIEQSRMSTNAAQVVVAAKNNADSFEYARMVRSAQQKQHTHMSQAADNAKARSIRKERITMVALSPTQAQRRRATFNGSSTENNAEAMNAETVRSLRAHRLRSSLLKPTLDEQDHQHKLELRRLKARKEEEAADRRRRAQLEQETSLSSSCQTPTPSIEENNNNHQSDNNHNNTTTTTTTTNAAQQQQQQQQQQEQREAFLQERKALEAERAAFTKAQAEAAAAAAAFQRASDINDERRKIRERERDEIRKQREQEREEIRDQREREREYEARIETERLEEVQRTKRRQERSRERERSSFEQQRKKKDKNSNSTKETSTSNIITTQSNNHHKSRCRSSSSKHAKKKKKRSMKTRCSRLYDEDDDGYEKEESSFPSFRDMKSMMEDSGLYFHTSCATITSCFGDEHTLQQTAEETYPTTHTHMPPPQHLPELTGVHSSENSVQSSLDEGGDNEEGEGPLLLEEVENEEDDPSYDHSLRRSRLYAKYKA